MSGIYIPMEMQKEGTVITIHKLNGKFYASVHGTELCPLIPIPDHGRLIDADALMENAQYKGTHDILTAWDVVAAPTIIPAEEGGRMIENICPKCGAVLNGFIITTIPPINGVVCPSCGWRHEKKEKIIRSVYQEPKPQTNYDRLVSKTTEELAEWLAKILDHCENKMPNELCRMSCPLYKCCTDGPDNIEDWLKSPVEVDE